MRYFRNFSSEYDNPIDQMRSPLATETRVETQTASRMGMLSPRTFFKIQIDAVVGVVVIFVDVFTAGKTAEAVSKVRCNKPSPLEKSEPKSIR